MRTAEKGQKERNEEKPILFHRLFCSMLRRAGGAVLGDYFVQNLYMGRICLRGMVSNVSLPLHASHAVHRRRGSMLRTCRDDMDGVHEADAHGSKKISGNTVRYPCVAGAGLSAGRDALAFP